jgi:predicted DNA-binding helix-hairpin-helix protein
MELSERLSLLAGSARYDASCASSGSIRRREPGGIGNAAACGICHSYTEDGRCVSLFKILLTNHCVYDCAYCINRESNDIRRTALTTRELVDLTLHFYQRNYIEGLFLSSGIFQSPDSTMERQVRVARELREKHRFCGYIHLKCIPGASEDLLRQAGVYADRLSVNIEIPTDENLRRLTARKSHDGILKPM